MENTAAANDNLLVRAVDDIDLASTIEGTDDTESGDAAAAEGSSDCDCEGAPRRVGASERAAQRSSAS